MEYEDFNGSAGKVEKSHKGLYYTFCPNKLAALKLNQSNQLIKKLEEANLAIGNLNGVGHALVNPHLLIKPYLRKEAVWSSKIEGTRTSLSDVFIYEAENKPLEKQNTDFDLKEVINYINSTELGLKEIKTKDLDLELILVLHRKLLGGVRGASKDPGKIRTEQNWIGPPGSSVLEATYVPPEPEKLNILLQDLFDYLTKNDELPSLIKIGLLHYQFEAIHPFRDGNGRIGRLLITLYLCKKGVLSLPLLYTSGYFDKHKEQYYDLLLEVSKKGDYEKWLNYFLDAVIEQAKDATKRILALEEYSKKTKEKLMQKRNMNALKILESLFINPYISIPSAAKIIKTRYPTAKRAVLTLVKEGILTETGNKPLKMYIAKDINKILS